VPPNPEPSSFRDPTGFLFRRDGVLYRQVNPVGIEDYDRLMKSGLYIQLIEERLLISHEEVSASGPGKVLRPEPIPFISYPYEWCFSQLKDAALATLTIQSAALEKGMALKDASAYNIQFHHGRPVLIDTLSFEEYREGEPWVAYRQFCQHFLAPLALMSHTDVRLSQLLRVYIDGIPLDLASSLLPAKTKLSLGLGAHIHMHARAQEKYAEAREKPAVRKMGRTALLGIIESLRTTIEKLTWKPAGTEWAEYYADTNYTEAGLKHKEALVAEYVQRTNPSVVWDLGANTGMFSKAAARHASLVVSSDVDPAAVELNYLDCRKAGTKNILPLLLDLTNPSPALGWQNRERMSLSERGPADMVLALALIHHLAIGNNVPFPVVAEFLGTIGRKLVIEFVPKTDSQVKRLLVTREDIFTDYTRESFEQAFAAHFSITATSPVKDSDRVLYLMERRT